MANKVTLVGEDWVLIDSCHKDGGDVEFTAFDDHTISIETTKGDDRVIVYVKFEELEEMMHHIERWLERNPVE